MAAFFKGVPGLSLRAKMLAAFGVLIVFLVSVGLAAFFALRSVNTRYRHITQLNMPKITELTLMRGTAKDIRAALYRLGLAENSPDDIKMLAETVDDLLGKYVRSDQEFVSLGLTDEEKALHQATEEAWKSLSEMIHKMVEMRKGSADADRKAFHETLSGEFRTRANTFFKALGELIDYQNTEAKQWVEEAEIRSRMGERVSLASVMVGILCSLLTGILFSGNLARKLNLLSDTLFRSADSVTASSRQVAAIGNGLSERASEQAAAIQETSAAVDEVNATVSNNVQNAKLSQEVSAATEKSAEQGKAAMTEVMTAMEEIGHSNEELGAQIEANNREISEIVRVITEIDEKTRIINDIVFQTKLLSFNASVEAARAGEHGKGFAVVAEEVGNLAVMSGKAAQEISSVVAGSVERVQSIVTDSKSKVERLVLESKRKLGVGSEKVHECDRVLEEILSGARRVNEMVTSIATASEEQERGMHEIALAIHKLNEVNQAGVVSSQEAAVSGRDLTSHGDTLNSVVAELMSMVKGENQERRMEA